MSTAVVVGFEVSSVPLRLVFMLVVMVMNGIVVDWFRCCCCLCLLLMLLVVVVLMLLSAFVDVVVVAGFVVCVGC